MPALPKIVKVAAPPVCAPPFAVVLVLPLSAHAPPRPPVQILDALISDPRSPLQLRPARPFTPTEQSWWKEWRDAVAQVVPVGLSTGLASAIESAAAHLDPEGKGPGHTFSNLCQQLRTSSSVMAQLGKSEAMRLVSLASATDDLIDTGACANPDDFESWEAFAATRTTAARLLARYGTGVTVESQ